MDQELIAYLEDRFREVQEQFASFREETNQQFAVSSQRFERLEEEIRHNGVEIEGLRGDIRQIADGVAGANERLDVFQKETAVEFKNVRAEIRVLARGVFEQSDSRSHAPKTKALVKTRQKGKGRPPS